MNQPLPPWALVTDPEPVSIFNVNHSSIVKPNSSDYETVATLVRFSLEVGLNQ